MSSEIENLQQLLAPLSNQGSNACSGHAYATSLQQAEQITALILLHAPVRVLRNQLMALSWADQRLFTLAIVMQCYLYLQMYLVDIMVLSLLMAKLLVGKLTQWR